MDRPREEWTEIAVPAIVSEDTFARVGQQLEDNKRFASRNSKVPSLLQAWPPARPAATPTTAATRPPRRATRSTTTVLGSDDYRYQGGRVCDGKPVRADYLNTVVWDHITGLLADPALIRAEIDRRLTQARTSNPVTRQRKQLELALAKAATSVTAMIQAYSEQLITIDELRTRMPHLRARETSLRSQIEALDAQAADQDAYLKLADDLDGFLAQLAAAPPPPASANGSGCCGCWSRTSSSDRRRSPSATASRSGNGPPAAAATKTTPTRRVTCARVIHCVGGVMSPLIFNIALSTLDQHLMAPWKPGGVMCRPRAGARPAATRDCRTGDLSVMRTISPC